MQVNDIFNQNKKLEKMETISNLFHMIPVSRNKCDTLKLFKSRTTCIKRFKRETRSEAVKQREFIVSTRRNPVYPKSRTLKMKQALIVFFSPKPPPCRTDTVRTAAVRGDL